MKELLVCVWTVFEHVLQLRVKPPSAGRAVTSPDWHTHAPITVRIDLDYKLCVAVNSRLVNYTQKQHEGGQRLESEIPEPGRVTVSCRHQAGAMPTRSQPTAGSSQGPDLQNGNHSRGDSTLKAACGWSLYVLEAASPLWMIPTIHLWLLDLDYFC